MIEGNAANGMKMLEEWIRDYVTDKDEDNEISDESKEILLQLKTSNNIRITSEGDSGTQACGCCDGYYEEYYNIFVDDKLLYETIKSLTESGLSMVTELIITRVK